METTARGMCESMTAAVAMCRVAPSITHAPSTPFSSELGRDPACTAALKAKVDANRPVTPLFDTARWVRNVERAYGLIWDNHMAGNPPRRMDVVED